MRLLGPGGFLSPINMLSNEWRKPFNISIGLHIIVVIIAMLAPTLFDRPGRLPEIYTVNLFTAIEVAEISPPAAKTSSAKTAEKPAVRQIEPEAKKPAVSIEPAKPEPAAPAQTVIAPPVSLNPTRLKVKVGKTKEEEDREKAKLSQVVNRIKAGAEVKEAKAKAEQSAKDAVSKLADSLKTTTPAPAAGTGEKAASTQADSTAKTAGISGPKGSTGIEMDFYMKQYVSAVYQRIHDHWVLPDLQNWDNALEAVLIITIRKDGVVTKNYFETKSANIYFNQFVLKAVKESSPLPPFPDQLDENTLEIGLRFKPGELY